MDHSLTYALLIGASEFPKDPEIRDIPNVTANIELLKNCLIDPAVVGIPPDNIFLSLNENRATIERTLRKIVEGIKNKDYTLLVYYAGHGMLSDTEYKLYLTTAETSRADLEIDGIGIDVFRKHIRRCKAGRKIVVLDCCHSGAVIEAMGDLTSTIQAGIRGFEGTYVMTSAAPDEPSLFPIADPTSPTYFTGMMIQILEEGLPSSGEYCSLRDIYTAIEIDFTEKRKPALPRPQQSNFLDADKLYFSKNKQFKPFPSDELAWRSIKDGSDVWAFDEFREKFPLSRHFDEATEKILFLDEESAWKNAVNQNTLSGYIIYKRKYPAGRHINDAKKQIELLRTHIAKPENAENLKDPYFVQKNPMADQSNLHAVPEIVEVLLEKNKEIPHKKPPSVEISWNRPLKLIGTVMLILIILGTILFYSLKQRNDLVNHDAFTGRDSISSSRDTLKASSPRVVDSAISIKKDRNVKPSIIVNEKRSNIKDKFSNLDAVDLHNKATQYFAQGKFAIAVKYYTQALEVDPNDTNSLIKRAYCYTNLNKYDNALQDFDQCISLGMKNPKIYFVRAIVYSYTSRFDEAIADYTKFLEHTIDAEAYEGRGSAYYSKNEYNKAVGEYTKAIDLKGNSRCYYNRALAYKQLGDVTNECKDLHKAKVLGYKDAQSLIDTDCK